MVLFDLSEKISAQKDDGTCDQPYFVSKNQRSTKMFLYDTSDRNKEFTTLKKPRIGTKVSSVSPTLVTDRNKVQVPPKPRMSSNCMMSPTIQSSMTKDLPGGSK